MEIVEVACSMNLKLEMWNSGCECWQHHGAFLLEMLQWLEMERIGNWQERNLWVSHDQKGQDLYTVTKCNCIQCTVTLVYLVVLSGHVVVLYMMVHHGDVSPKLF